MSEWKEWNGSDEQIAEMLMAEEEGDGYILRYEDGTESERCFFHLVSSRKVTHYLICQRHPLADMICQQARTGQPVWALMTERQYWIMPLGEFEGKAHINGKVMIKTTKPDWNIPNAEYSFTEFKEEV